MGKIIKDSDEIKLNTSAIKQEMQEFEKIAYNKACEDIKKLIIDRICMNCKHERCITLIKLFVDINHKLQEV